MAVYKTDDDLLKKVVANRAKIRNVATPVGNNETQFSNFYKGRVGYNTKTLPTYRPEKPAPTGLLDKYIFDPLNKITSGAMYPLAKNYAEMTKARDSGNLGQFKLNQAVKRGLMLPAALDYAKDFYKGVSGDINYTGGSVVSQMLDDPKGVRSYVPKPAQQVLDNKLVRGGLGLGLEIGADPTTYVPLGGPLKAAGGVAGKGLKAVGATDNLINPAIKATKEFGPVRTVLKRFGTLTPELSKAQQAAQKVQSSMNAEVSDIVFKMIRGEVDPRKIEDLKTYTGVLVDGLSVADDAPEAAKLLAKGLPTGMTEQAKKQFIENFNNEIDIAAKTIEQMGGNLDKALLQRYFMGGVTFENIPKEYQDIIRPFRRFVKEPITEGMVKTGQLTRETVERYPDYATKFYPSQDEIGRIEDLDLVAKGSQKIGPEMKITKLSKGDELRAIEYIKAHPEKFPAGTTEKIIKMARGADLATQGKSTAKIVKEVAKALQFDDVDSYINSIRGRLVTDKRLPGRLFDVARVTTKDIAGFTGRSVKEMGIRDEWTRLRKAKDYAGMEQLLTTKVFNGSDDFYNALVKRGYSQVKPYMIDLQNGKYLNILKNSDEFKALSQLSEGTLRENWEMTRMNASVGDVVKELERRAGSKATGDMSEAAWSMREFLIGRLGDAKFREYAYEGKLMAGMVEDASITIAKTIEMGLNRVTRENFLNLTTKHFGKTADEVAALGADAKFYRQIPDSPRYSSLAGKYVPDSIYEDVVGILSVKNNWLSRATNAWKQVKLFSPLNFASVSRNQFGDMIMMSVSESPMSITRQLADLPKAIKEYQNQGPVYKAMLERGVFANTFAAQEGTRSLAKATGKLADTPASRAAGALDTFTDVNIKTRFPGVGAGKEMYSYTSDINKINMVKYQMSKGKSIDEAIRLANKATFDYSALPQGLTGFRDNFMPFMTFKYFALQLAWDTLINRTGKIAALPKAKRAVESLSEPQPGEEQGLPDYMKENRGLNVRLPWKNAKGDSRYLNLQYAYPFGDVLETKPLDIMLGNPFVRVPIELAMNKSLYFNNNIAEPLDPRSKQFAEYGKYALEQLGPKPGLREFGKIGNAITGAPDRYGNRREIVPTALDVGLGIKTSTPNIELGQKFSYYDKKEELSKIESKIRSVMRDQSLSERQKDKELARLRELHKKTYLKN